MAKDKKNDSAKGSQAKARRRSLVVVSDGWLLQWRRKDRTPLRAPAVQLSVRGQPFVVRSG